MEGDVTAAIRVLSSSDTLVHPSPDVVDVLRTKHPDAPADLRQAAPPRDNNPIVIDKECVAKAINSFPRSSSGGIDGLRPGHLRLLTSPSSGEAGERLKVSISRLVNRLASGNLSHHPRGLLFSASILPFKKKDGGIRPIAVGNVFRRLAAKIVCKAVSHGLGRELFPVQLGVGIRGGCEGAAHAARSFFLDPAQSSQIAIKLDVRNAFNSVRRDHVLEVCKLRCPLIYNLAFLSYGSPSTLLAGDHIISSSTGVQQGDPLGPLLFSLAIDEVARSVSSPLNLWYLDDATIAGPPLTVAQDLRKIVPSLKSLGLVVNPAKSEISNIGLSQTEFTEAVSSIDTILSGVSITPIEELSILGSPIHQVGIRNSLANKLASFNSMSDKLSSIDSHPAFFLLKNCLSFPKLVFLLRSAPCFLEREALESFDLSIRSCAGAICNTILDDPGWLQAKLPVSLGGLGLRSVLDISLPAYLSSLAFCRPITQSVLPTHIQHDCDDRFDSAVEVWSREDLPSPSEADITVQKEWDNLKCSSLSEALKPTLNQHRMACLSSASQPHSGAWLNAIPSSSFGTLLDNESFRIGVALRIGLEVCIPHK